MALINPAYSPEVLMGLIQNGLRPTALTLDGKIVGSGRPGYVGQQGSNVFPPGVPVNTSQAQLPEGLIQGFIGPQAWGNSPGIYPDMQQMQMPELGAPVGEAGMLSAPPQGSVAEQVPGTPGGLFGRMRQGLGNNWLPIMQAGLGMMAGGGWGRMPRDFLQIAGEAGGPALGTKMHLDQQAIENRIRQQQADSFEASRQAYARQADAQARYQQEKFDWEKGDRRRLEEAAKQLPEPWRKMAQVDPKAAIAGWAATLKPSGAGTQYERSFSRLRELQMKVDAGAKLSPQEWLEASTARALLSQERSFVDPSTGQIYTYKPITIPQDITVGSGSLSQHGAQQKNAPQPSQQFSPAQLPGSAVPNEGGRKPVDADTEKELRGYGDANVQLTGLATSFSPKYGGWMLDSVAQAALLAGRRLPEGLVGKDIVDQAQWWQRYYNWSNDIRAAKFGLTLTGNELTAFEKATPKPSDSPESIQRSLKFQQDLLQRKLNSRVEALRAGGYNMGQAESLAYPKNSDDNVVRFRRNPKTGVLEIEK